MELASVLKLHKNEIGQVLSIDYKKLPFVVFDFSKKNTALAKIDVSDANKFTAYVKNEFKKHKVTFGIGLYNEDRTIYKTGLFQGSTPRTIHLGIDIFVELGTKVIAPLNGEIHSFANNSAKGDYGPTIILKHKIDGIEFYTLYGHLSLGSLNKLAKGKLVEKGDILGEVGKENENGNWPPHLHFQIIRDMMGNSGDFKGVASAEDKKEFLNLCPDPNLILQIKKL